MSQSNIRFEGYLDLLTEADSGIKKKAKKKYCVLYQNSGSNLARLDLYESEEKFIKASKGSTLLYCKQIQEISRCQTDDKQSFKLKVPQTDSSFIFICKSPVELEIWLSAFHDVMKEIPRMAEPDYEVSNRAWRRDSASSGSSGQSHPRGKTGRQSTVETRPLGLYNVQILETAGSKRCNLFGPHKLQITNINLTLWSPNFTQPVLVWPYEHIRRFGFGHKFFKLEAGRRADSGEGRFGFETSQGQEILGLAQRASENSMRA